MWNIRLVKEDTDEGVYYSLREVFFDVDGLPYAHGRAEASSNSLDELQTYIDWMQEALANPILEYPKDFTGDVNKWG